MFRLLKKMVNLLIVFLLCVFVVQSMGQAEITCQKLSAYYIGQFQHPDNRARTFNAQFEVKLEANLADKRIYLANKQWNRTFSDGKDLKFHMCGFNSHTDCLPAERNCSISTGDVNLFNLQFHLNAPEFVVFAELIWLPQCNNSFTLINPVGNCAKLIKDNNPRWANQTLYQQCYCCGDDYLPAPSLGCPVYSGKLTSSPGQAFDFGQ